MSIIIHGEVPEGFQFFLDTFNLQSRTPEQRIQFVKESLKIPEETDPRKFFRENSPIWNSLADFMGYGVIKIPKKGFTIYSKRKLTLENLEKLQVKKDPAIKDFYPGLFFLNWMPTHNYEQAEMCENRLIKLGDYHVSEFFYSLEDGIAAAYHTENNKFGPVGGVGNTRIEAVCNACLEFHKKYLNGGFNG